MAKLFNYPVFNADLEVEKLYKKNRKCYKKLKKTLPDYIKSFPVKKKYLSKAVLDDHKNLKKIIKIVHPEIRALLKRFIENKMNKKNDILVFVDAKKKDINKKLKHRYGSSLKIVKKLKKFQLAVERKKNKSDFIIINNFKHDSVKKNVKKVMEKILINA